MECCTAGLRTGIAVVCGIDDRGTVDDRRLRWLPSQVPNGRCSVANTGGSWSVETAGQEGEDVNIPTPCIQTGSSVGEPLVDLVAKVNLE